MFGVYSANLHFSEKRGKDAKCLLGEIIVDKSKMLNTW